MIRSYFGLEQNPFSAENITLLPHQSDIYDALVVHCQQGGLSVIIGEPGTGKSIIKQFIKEKEKTSKKYLIPVVSRTLHTYKNTIKILCNAFSIDFEGSDFKCEKRLIEEAEVLNRQNKSLITIIDDAHLMSIDVLRKLRLLFEDFPKNHNLILVGQPALLNQMRLKINDDIRSRVTYSTIVQKLTFDQMHPFIIDQLNKVRLPINVFSEEAIEVIIRAADGFLRKCRNLCISSLLESVRAKIKEVNIDIVNRVLIQPHWRTENDLE